MEREDGNNHGILYGVGRSILYKWGAVQIFSMDLLAHKLFKARRREARRGRAFLGISSPLPRSYDTYSVHLEVRSTRSIGYKGRRELGYKRTTATRVEIWINNDSKKGGSRLLPNWRLCN